MESKMIYNFSRQKNELCGSTTAATSDSVQIAATIENSGKICSCKIHRRSSGPFILARIVSETKNLATNKQKNYMFLKIFLTFQPCSLLLRHNHRPHKYVHLSVKHLQPNAPRSSTKCSSKFLHVDQTVPRYEVGRFRRSRQ